jgi:hypothetical protein
MARKSKDIITVVDGVKITQCAYRGPRKGESTYDINKSKYTVWAQTVSKYTRGTNGVQGTVEKIAGFGVQ